MNKEENNYNPTHSATCIDDLSAAAQKKTARLPQGTRAEQTGPAKIGLSLERAVAVLPGAFVEVHGFALTVALDGQRDENLGAGGDFDV